MIMFSFALGGLRVWLQWNLKPKVVTKLNQSDSMVNLWISCAEYTLNIQRFLLKLIEFGQDSQRRLTCETLSLQILFIFLHFHVSRKGDLPHLISEPYSLQATRSRMEQSESKTLPGWLILFTNLWFILLYNFFYWRLFIFVLNIPLSEWSTPVIWFGSSNKLLVSSKAILAM